MSTNTQSTFSLERILTVRSEGFAAIKTHAATITSIGTAIESLDAALQTAMGRGSADEQQKVVLAARALNELISAEIRNEH